MPVVDPKDARSIPSAPTNAAGWDYEGKVVIVTGAASGIGNAVASLLIGLGARVHGIDMQPIATAGLESCHRTDLGDPASIQSTADGMDLKIDALFNCAGRTGTAERRTVFAVNFCGLRHLTELLIPRMTPGGAICSIGSTSAVSWPVHVEVLSKLLAISDFEAAVDWLDQNGDAITYPYDLSKEAVNIYTARRSVDLLHERLRINCVNPGATKTPATPEFAKTMLAKDHGPEMMKNYPRLLGRRANPEEQAWPMIFLNSRFASFVSGTSLFVDAGLTGSLFTDRLDPAVAQGMRWHPPA